MQGKLNSVMSKLTAELILGIELEPRPETKRQTSLKQDGDIVRTYSERVVTLRVLTPQSLPSPRRHTPVACPEWSPSYSSSLHP
jgi:hypothetical protein